MRGSFDGADPRHKAGRCSGHDRRIPWPDADREIMYTGGPAAGRYYCTMMTVPLPLVAMSTLILSRALPTHP